MRRKFIFLVQPITKAYKQAQVEMGSAFTTLISKQINRLVGKLISPLLESNQSGVFVIQFGNLVGWSEKFITCKHRRTGTI